jgi:hypothetical protein
MGHGAEGIGHGDLKSVYPSSVIWIAGFGVRGARCGVWSIAVRLRILVTVYGVMEA